MAIGSVNGNNLLLDIDEVRSSLLERDSLFFLCKLEVSVIRLRHACNRCLIMYLSNENVVFISLPKSLSLLSFNIVYLFY